MQVDDPINVFGSFAGVRRWQKRKKKIKSELKRVQPVIVDLNVSRQWYFCSGELLDH